jgi:hypothetical protein
MYKVVKDFYDLQDFTDTKSGRVYHEYIAGDTYPRNGKEVEQARIDELASASNLQGAPLIERVKEAEDVKEDTAAEKKPAARRTRKPKEEK